MTGAPADAGGTSRSYARSNFHGEAWERAYRSRGEVPHQSPAVLNAARRDSEDLKIVDVGDSLSAFFARGALATCLVQGAGVIATRDGEIDGYEILSTVQRQLGVQAVYMPLLYEDLGTSEALLAVRGSRLLKRRPSPFISWSCRGKDVWGRCESRVGRRASRRRSHFERAGLDVRTIEGESAVEAVALIERLSWKADVGQDMWSRGQFGFYRNLIESGEPLVRVVFAGDAAIAYRLDLTVGRTVFCLKWSFAEPTRAVSPGFYLLAVDLAECYGELDVDRIDLFGAPDTLKDALSSGARRRTDLVWPEGSLGKAVLSERAAHDRAASAAYASGTSIRSAYYAKIQTTGVR